MLWIVPGCAELVDQRVGQVTPDRQAAASDTGMQVVPQSDEASGSASGCDRAEGVTRPGDLPWIEDQAMDALARGRFVPLVGQSFPLAGAAAAHRAIENRPP